jgi:tetratricopeptide (TPR) repeat protein
LRLWDSPLRSIRSAAVLSWALAVVVFLNASVNGFAYDDNLILLGNPAVQSLETLPQALTEPYWPGLYGEGRGIWRPATTAFLAGQWALFGGNPVGFHVVNILLHAGVSALVVVLLGAFLPVGASFLGGLLFAVHPVHVEAVANVVGVAELLSTFFFLSACILIVGTREWLGLVRTGAVLGLYLLAFLTKESAVTLLGIVLLLDCSREDLGVKDMKSYLGRRWPLYGGMLAVAGLALTGRFLVLGMLAKPFPPLGAHLLEEIPRIWTVVGTWPHVIRLLFFPLDLSVDYGPAVIPLAFGWNAENLTGLILVLAALVLAFFAWRQGALSRDRLSPRAIGWGVVWFVITVSSTSNFFFLSGILLSERTLYLPSVGFVAAASWALVGLWRVRPRVALAGFLAAMAALGARTWTRTPTWENNMEVFQTLTSEHPEAGRAQWVLGDTYLAAGRRSEGLRAYRLAVGLLRGHYSLAIGVSRNLIAAGHDNAAVFLLREAQVQRPQFGVAPGLLAQSYSRQGRFREAEEAARYSLGKDSTDALQYHVLARSLEAQGRLVEAAEAREGALRHANSGKAEQWAWLAELQVALGDTVGAQRSLDSARLWAVSLREKRELDSILAGFWTGSH